MDAIKKYFLHKDDYTKLHFEINDLKTYFLKNKNHSTRAHNHGFYQIIWFADQGRHYVDYEVINHSKDTILFINVNQIHYFCPDSLNDGVLIHFNDFFLDQFNHQMVQRFSLSLFNEIGDPFIVLNDELKVKINYLISLLKEELKLGIHIQKEQLFFIFCTFLLSLEREKGEEEGNKLFKNPDFELAYKFKREVYLHNHTFHKIDFYSDLLHINVKKLTAVVKEQLGDTPSNVIQSVKILEAKRKLANKKSSIQEVAFDLGFDQPTYFTKYFKKATGITPKEFQLQIP